jgi:hypothetical protein
MKSYWMSIALMILESAAPAAPTPDRLTPADAEAVVTVNVRQLLQAPVVRKHALDPLKLLLERHDELQQLFAAAGLDPLRDVDTISLSTSGNPTASGKLLAVVRGRFDPAKVRAAAGEYARKHPGRLKSLKAGELPLWEITSDNKSYYAAFAGDNSLVVSNTKEDTAAAVGRASQPPQPLNKEMQAALEQLKDGEPVWLALVATDSIKQLLRSDELAKNFADALRSVTGTLELTDAAQLTLVVHSSTATAAGQIKQQLDNLLKLLAFVGGGEDARSQIVKEVIDNVKLGTDKNDVSLRLRLTDAQLAKIRKKER